MHSVADKEDLTEEDVTEVPTNREMIEPTTAAESPDSQHTEKYFTRLFTPSENGILHEPATDPTHQLLVHYLLEPTREMFQFTTRFQAPATDASDSYFDQWKCLSRAMSDIWTHSNKNNELMPFLVVLSDLLPERICWSIHCIVLSMDISPLVRAVLHNLGKTIV